MFNAEQLQEKWAPILDYQGLDEIKDSHRRSVTAILLENQEKELRESHEFLYESPTNSRKCRWYFWWFRWSISIKLAVLPQVSTQF
jgi:hypothetical protein